jgi:hypothetical protein
VALRAQQAQQTTASVPASALETYVSWKVALTVMGQIRVFSVLLEPALVVSFKGKYVCWAASDRLLESPSV